MKRKLFSLFLAICMMLSLIPVTAFAADEGKFTLTCQGDAGTSGGNVYYKLNGEGEFQQVNITDGKYDPISMTDETTSITIKFVLSENYQLDTERGVSLRVNGNEQFNQKGDNIADFTEENGHTFTFTSEMLGNDKTVSTSSFELEFGFAPAGENGKLGFGGIDASRGKIEYKFNENDGFTAVGTTDSESRTTYNSVELGENSSITVKISPAVKTASTDGYRIDTVKGVSLRKNGEEVASYKDSALAPLIGENTDGSVYYTLTFALSDVAKSNFELDFSYENDNFTDDGGRPHGEDNYLGTIKKTKLTITGDVNVCINDSILINKNGVASEKNDIQYHYNGGTVDFYIQCHLTQRYTAITINGKDYYSQLPTPDTEEGRKALLDACKGQLNEFKLIVPYNKDGYEVSASIKELDESDKDYWQVGNFLWRYDRSENEDDLIKNGKMELINVVYSDTTYELKDLTNEESGFHWKEDEYGGEAVLPAGATVTVKIVPDAGYQLTSFSVNGFGFGTGKDPSVFTFVVEQGNFHLGAHISEVEDKVVANSEAVAGGEIKIGKGEIDTGSVQLTVEDNEDEGLRNEFENVELDSGFAVQSVLDINLQQVLYKGREDDFWANEMSSLSQAAQISFDLADAFGNVVVLHKKSDSSIEKIIPTYENGRITFETNSFSPFALAVVESEDPKYQIGFDSRGKEDCVSVKIGSGTAVSAVPWASRTYSSGDDTFTITINVPEDRKDYKPLVSVERMVGKGEPMDAFEPTLSGRNGVYSFSFVPNKKFSVSNAEFVVIINWTEYDAIWVGDDQYCIKTVNVNPDLGDIEVLTPGSKSVSLGDETKTVYDRQDTTYTVDIKFAPKPGRVRLSRLFVGDSELSADNGNISPSADGSYIYTVTIPVNGAEEDSNLDIAAEYDENVAVASITVQASPAVTTYSIGEDIDVAGGKIKVNYENGWSEVIDMEAKMISGFDSSTADEKTVTVSFEEKTTTFTVEVVETERVGTPVISPNGGSFTGSQTVTITCPTEGAKIFYSTDGKNYAEYTAPFTISTSTTISAYATKGELLGSMTASAEFTKKSSGGTGGSGGSSGGSGGSSGGSSTPSNPTVDGKEQTWNDVASDIEKLPEGTTETISLNGNNTVPADVVKAIAASNAEVTLKVDSVFSWTIDGSDIDEEDAKAANLTITKTTVVADNTPRGTEGTSFSVKGTNVNSQLNINFKATHSGEFANLYKKVDGKLVFVDNVKIDENGAAIGLDVSEKGEYVVMLGEFSDREGDMDNDGVMNSKDALAVIKDFLGIENGANPLVSDLNGDGYINSKDALIIIEKFLGIE